MVRYIAIGFFMCFLLWAVWGMKQHVDCYRQVRPRHFQSVTGTNLTTDTNTETDTYTEISLGVRG